MPTTRIARRATVVLASALVALLGGSMLDNGVDAQPRITSETPISLEMIHLSSPAVVGPGGNVHFFGFCHREVGAVEATVRAVQVDESGSEPFEFSVVVNVDAVGNFLRHIEVPGNAPNGLYRLELTCAYPSGPFRGDDELFTVDGPFITTTTSTPLRATPHVNSHTAAPATPVHTQATLTG